MVVRKSERLWAAFLVKAACLLENLVPGNRELKQTNAAAVTFKFPFN